MNILPIKNNIKKIIHISDIHIRQNKRVDEYKKVFDTFFNLIKEYSKEETLIVNTGDIFHTKLDLQPEGIKLSETFLRGCADLFPVILIAGNHDCLISNKNRLDSISPIVDAINHPNLFYLKKSDLYGAGNICFNNYSVFDDIEKYIKGIDIPSVYRNKYEHFICLFHGTVDGSISEMGFKLVNKSIPLSIFDGHDFSLLGDIHLHQTLQEYDYQNNKPVIRFPGSMIQQSHGESLHGHGYTLWNLQDKTYKHIEIPNDYGYFTVRVEEGKIKTDLSKLPKKVRLRLSLYETLPTQTKEILKELKQKTEFIEPPTYTREEKKEGEKRNSTLAINLLQGDLRNRDHQIKLITDHLINKLEIKDEDLIKEVIRINDETNSEIKTDDIIKSIRWNPVKFEWNNLFSFGEDNIIDFTKAKDVVGLFATNASGKSSIFSALSWCIFDKCERDFKANNIINDQKMSCRAQLEFEIGGVHYFIERVGRMDKKSNVKVNVKFWRVIDGKEEDLTGIERSDTNNTIRAYLGTYEDFLLTSLSVQRSGKYQTSFIDLGDSGRKDLLAQFLGLDIFDKLHDVANEKLNSIISTLKVYKNEDIESNLLEYNNALSRSESSLNEANKCLSEWNEKDDKISTKILEESSKTIKIENYPEHTLVEINQSIEKYKNIISHNQKELGPILQEQKKCNTEMEEAGKLIKETDFDDINKRYSEWQKRIKEKNDLSVPLSKKITEAKSLKEKVEKMKDYEFNPTCEFCLKNAQDVIMGGKNAEKELEKYKEEIGNLLKEQTRLDLQIKDLSSSQTEYERYNELLRLRIKAQETYLGWEKKADEVCQKIDRARESLLLYEKELEVYNKNKEAIEHNQKLIKVSNELSKELWVIRQEKKRINENIQSLIGKKSVIISKIEECNKKLNKIKEIEKTYKAYDLYTKSVCRDGIPYDVIAAAVPHIESEVNSILSQIVEFHAKFDVDGKNIIPYIVYDERHWLMSLGSGMEQFILSTAIRVALTNLSNLPRANFLVIDEGFGVLAAETLASMHTLFHFLKTNFDFVIVISHLDTLRDMVDSHMEIKKENGFSKVNFV